MKKFSYCFLFLLIFLGCGEEVTKENNESKTVSDPSPPKKIIWEKDGKEMVLIPSGSFKMGDSKNELEEWMADTKPVRTVALDEFYMDVHEVTVGQFMQFVDRSGYKWEDKWANWNHVVKYSPGEDYPMTGIDWNDATAYAEWAGKRLPTEAEWEYAARGLIGQRQYSWGNEKPDGSQCNFADKNADEALRSLNPEYTWADMTVDDGYKYTAPVGSFKPNGYGLHDMAGNVWEWCQDWYSEDYYSSLAVDNPQGPAEDSTTRMSRVLRGGSWFNVSYYLRVSYRHDHPPNNGTTTYGFRCVSDVTPIIGRLFWRF